MKLVLLTVLLPLCSCISLQPDYSFLDSKGGYHLEQTYHGSIASQYQPQALLGHHQAAGNDQCELHKVGFLQDLYFQYIQYKTSIPKLNEFTVCMWNKFTNHSNDHPLFSYAVDGQPRAIYSWVSNTDRSSYYSLAVNGHTFYRLNYPLRLNRWYHSCQSWNGRTGEWQIWVNAERVGRGFHNRLVGHKIPSGGVAITGQEQTQVGGGFQEGYGAPKGSGGMLGEVTMLQLYSVALTAGKAHKDHKHHHAHHFDHNGQPITTPLPPTPAPRPNQPNHPLLTAGQINPQVNLNFAGPQQQPPQAVPGTLPNGQQYEAQLINGQFTGNLVSQQLLGGQQPQPQASPFIGFAPVPRQQGPQTFVPSQPIPAQPQFQLPTEQQQYQLPTAQQQYQLPTGAQSYQQQSFSETLSEPIPLTDYSGSQPTGSGLVHASLTNPANVQIIDSTISNHQLFKRNNAEATADAPKTVTKRDTKENNQKKRELILSGGQIIDDGLGDSNVFSGLATYENNQPIIQQQKSMDEREPAEAEVMAVMNICGGCDEEPFAKALVFGWRSVHKKLYSGAIYSPAVPQCRVF